MGETVGMMLFGPADWTAVWSAAGGASFGAITSGTISFFLQNRSFREERDRRTGEWEASQQVFGFGLSIKLNRIHSAQATLYRHLEDSLKRDQPAAELEELEPWQLVVPFPISLGQVHFSKDGLRRLRELGGDRILDLVFEMDTIYDRCGTMMDEYNQVCRQEISHLSPEKSEYGQVSFFSFFLCATIIEAPDYSRKFPSLGCP